MTDEQFINESKDNGADSMVLRSGLCGLKVSVWEQIVEILFLKAIKHFFFYHLVYFLSIESRVFLFISKPQMTFSYETTVGRILVLHLFMRSKQI